MPRVEHVAPVSRGNLQPLAVAQQQALENLTLRALKRSGARLAVKLQYRELDPQLVEEALPAVGDYPTKRTWEKAMHDARAQLRELSAKPQTV